MIAFGPVPSRRLGQSLDIKLGKEIEAVGQFGIKTAVITNASLLWRDDVREELQNADLVSVKIDSTREDVWRKVTCPHPGLKLEHILNGILAFSRVCRGDLITESMLDEDQLFMVYYRSVSWVRVSPIRYVITASVRSLAAPGVYGDTPGSYPPYLYSDSGSKYPSQPFVRPK
jgi:hypothetical protein